MSAAGSRPEKLGLKVRTKSQSVVSGGVRLSPQGVNSALFWEERSSANIRLKNNVVIISTGIPQPRVVFSLSFFLLRK
jgi:hypothetical protein